MLRVTIFRTGIAGFAGAGVVMLCVVSAAALSSAQEPDDLALRAAVGQDRPTYTDNSTQDDDPTDWFDGHDFDRAPYEYDPYAYSGYWGNEPYPSSYGYD